jgi:hypothetical protein
MLACYRDVATDRWAAATEILEASQSHAFDSLSSSEGRTPERLDKTKNTRPDGEPWSKRVTNVEVGGYEEWKDVSDHPAVVG